MRAQAIIGKSIGAVVTISLAAAQTLNLDTALGKTILGVNQPAIEVQVYTAAHVPLLPSFHSVAQWEHYAKELRRKLLDDVILRGEARRWAASKTRVEWLQTISSESGYHIRKLRYEAVPGLWVPALLYEPDKLSGRAPAILNVNGHEGDGVAIPYIQERCINLVKRGMLALNVEWFGKGQLDLPGFQHYRANQLDLVGSSGVAVHYLSLKRALDIVSGLEHADPSRIAVTGLSGGGWQTIILSALDERVRLANPVAGYSSFVTRSQMPDLDLGDSEQTPTDFATVLDYTHLTALMAPRPLLLTYNSRDSCCFRADYAVSPLLQAARPIFQLYGAADRLRYHLNYDAGHNYERDNREALYRMLRDFFFEGKSSFNVTEIPSRAEVRTKETLKVDLPANNADFHSLAVDLSRSLPLRSTLLPAASRSRLAKIVRARQFRVVAEPAGRDEWTGMTAAYWRFHIDDSWTVPAVEIAPANPKSTVLLVADSGRKSAKTEVERLLSAGQRVVALDPFYFGESKIGKRDFLFAFLVAALGDRPLGLQASQVASVARWLHKDRNLGQVTVEAVGPRSGLFALVAAALETQAISGLNLTQSMVSLQEILERDLTADKFPELFCSGLLEAFDIKQLKALAARVLQRLRVNEQQ